MTTEYKYRPPFKYVLFGICGLGVATIFGMAMISGDQIWFSIVVGIFCLLSLVMSCGLLIIFFRKLNTGALKLGNDFIEIPGRWKGRISLEFNDILEISEFDTYDHVIEIESKHGFHLIERNWMKPKDFDNLRIRFQENWKNHNST